jgi:hypothetical protein
MITYACTPSWRKIAVLVGGILCMLGTSFLSLDLNASSIPFIRLDKAAVYNMLHVPLFILITVLWLQIVQVYRLSAWQKAISAFCFSFSVGTLYEALQVLNPGRSASLEDIFINAAASLIGIALYLALDRSKPNLLRKIVCESDS